MTDSTCNKSRLELIAEDPAAPGWYATLHCWDPLEGMFPGAHFWDGEKWTPETRAGIQHWPTVFSSQGEAYDYAYLNDPDL